MRPVLEVRAAGGSASREPCYGRDCRLVSGAERKGRMECRAGGLQRCAGIAAHCSARHGGVTTATALPETWGFVRSHGFWFLTLPLAACASYCSRWLRLLQLLKIFYTRSTAVHRGVWASLICCLMSGSLFGKEDQLYIRLVGMTTAVSGYSSCLGHASGLFVCQEAASFVVAH